MVSPSVGRGVLVLIVFVLCATFESHASEMVVNKPGGLKERTIFFEGSADVSRQSAFYVNGNGEEVLHGKATRFKRNGQPWIETSFRHGNRHGKMVLHHNEGTTIFSFNNGLSEGPRVVLNESGALVSVEFFTNGVHMAPFNGEFTWEDKTVTVDMGRVVGGDLMTPEAIKHLRGHNLGAWAKQYMDSGDVTNAARYADKLLKYIKQPDVKEEDPWTYSEGVHNAHNVLGRVALRNGDIPEARRHLLLAGGTPGDAGTLGSFGPNMALAKELLQRGEKQVVLEYFDLCEKFWSADSLNRWREDVKAGNIPDFGASLDY